jgi:hypothetical protein
MLFGLSGACSAAEGGAVTFSVSPPLFKISMKPGDSWASFVKVINNNPYPVSVFAEVANFKSSESGGVEFIKDDSTSDYGKYMLGQWIALSKKALNIPSFSSVDVPFAISLPPNADPGGHYAAILLGNKPVDEVNGNVIKFSSKIASLILVKVDGQVKEQGDVAEFSSHKLFNSSLNANFKLRFKNQGNVHIHPEGQIKIYNVFGEERGNIEVNRSQNFGNILPESEKKWEFNWAGTNSILDAGLMRAELLLSYGDEGRQTVYRTIYFWTVNLKPTLIAVGTITIIILLIIWLIRRYIRKSVEQMKMQMGIAAQPKKAARKSAAPLRSKKIQLTNEPKRPAKEKLFIKIMNWSLLKKSLLAALFAVVSLVILSLYVYHKRYGFFNDTYVPEDPAAVVIVPTSTPPAAAGTAASSEAGAAASQASSSPAVQSRQVLVFNGSKQRDLGGRVKGLLLANNIEAIEATSTDVVYDDIASVIKFNPGQLEQAQAIDTLLNRQSELRQEETAGGQIIIMLGSRFK